MSLAKNREILNYIWSGYDWLFSEHFSLGETNEDLEKKIMNFFVYLRESISCTLGNTERNRGHRIYLTQLITVIFRFE